MIKHKIKPRIATAGLPPQPHNFFYRLVANQRFLAIIGLVFLIVIIFPLVKTYNQRRLVQREIEDVESQISDFENQNQQLKDLIAYLQSDQSLEEQARLNLNLKKPGEEVVIIENKPDGAVAVKAAENEEKAGNLIKWWRYFFD